MLPRCVYIYIQFFIIFLAEIKKDGDKKGHNIIFERE